MTDVGRRQFLGTVAALVVAGFADTALGDESAFESRGPRGEWGVEAPHRVNSANPGLWWFAKTEDQLHEEMRCWVGGIKDHHDLVIEHVRARVREKYARASKTALIDNYESKIEPKRRWTVEHALDSASHPWSTCPALSYVGTWLGVADLIERGAATFGRQTRGRERVAEPRIPAPEEAESWREMARVEHARYLHALDVEFAFGDRCEDAGMLYLDERGDLYAM